MQNRLNELRHAAQHLKASLALVVIVITTFALAIGANTTIFSIVDAVMLRPLPYEKPEQLVAVETVMHGAVEPSGLSYPDFFDWRRQNHTLTHLVSYHDTSFTFTGATRAVHLSAEVVSWDLLQMLGINPELGRGFAKEEEQRGTRVALISHSLWESHFGSDPSVLGRTINLSEKPYTIIGVMPASFRFPIDQPLKSVWTTLAVDDDPSTETAAVANRALHWLNAIGRLKPGISVSKADQDLRLVAAHLANEYPDASKQGRSARVEAELTAVLGDTRTLLMVVLGAVGLVLLIACGNVANLLLVRVRDRQREIALRCALGATRGRIVSQLLAESLMLAVAGGLVGSGLAFVFTRAALRLIPASITRAADAGVDLRVLGFALLVSLLSGLTCGIIPALTASKSDLISTIKEGGSGSISGRHWFRSAVVVGQTALGVVLTAGAGLLIASFVNLAHRNEGFNPDHLLTFIFNLPHNRYKDSIPQFYREYFEKLRSLPGVQSAGGSRVLPMTEGNLMMTFENPERPVLQGRRPRAELTPVSTDYFRTMQIQLLKGRDFTERDDMNSLQVMIVNQAFAETYFPGEEMLGKKLKPKAATGASGGPPLREVIGVVGNVLHSATQRQIPPQIYLPANQLPSWCCLYSVVRTTLEPSSLEPAVRSLVSSLDRDIPVTEMRTMPHLLSLQLSLPRFAMVLVGAFAGLAVTLTIVGLYGVMMFSVSRRTREMGVRLALGAQRSNVLNMVLRDAASLIFMGIGIGLIGVLAFGSLLKTMLYGTGPRNPQVLAAVCLIVGLTGLLAAFLPARRAANVEPMKALRTE